MNELPIIRQLYNLLLRSKFSYLHIKLPNFELVLELEKDKINKHQQTQITNQQFFQQSFIPVKQEEDLSNLSESQTQEEEKIHTIVSNTVGVFSIKSNELQKGKKVSKNEVLGIIKGLNTQEQVKSPVDGEITNVFIHNGEIADYGRLLFEIKETKLNEEK